VIQLLSYNPSLFVAQLLVLILSLSFHEWGHAFAAKHYGDRTAEMLGRLTFNPIKHIDPMGLVMIILVGIGYAKPVPTTPRNFNSKWAMPVIALAGPLVNLLIAFVVLNIHAIGLRMGLEFMQSSSMFWFVGIVSGLNLALMIFNLIPLGPLDGHYILPYLLPSKLARQYTHYNELYGMYALLGLMLLSVIGFPVFRGIISFGYSLRDYLTLF